MTDQTAFDPMDLRDPIGLCATCRHVRVISNARGSTFYLCQLAETDPRFDKYPRLPVLHCAGYEPAEEAGDHTGPPRDGDCLVPPRDGDCLVPPRDGDCLVIGAVILAAGQSRRMGRNKHIT